ncbi:MAG: hypothetical protein AAB480_02375 [Patescibacteria group bacterium]
MSDELKALSERISKLEKAVFGRTRAQRIVHSKVEDDYRGATGGVRLLIDDKFFASKRGLGDTRAALAKHNYHYSVQAVHITLNRLSKPSGPLVVFKEGGKKVYAQRK